MYRTINCVTNVIGLEEHEAALRTQCAAGPMRSGNAIIDSFYALCRAVGDVVASGFIFVLLQSWNSILIVSLAVGFSVMFLTIFHIGGRKGDI